MGSCASHSPVPSVISPPVPRISTEEHLLYSPQGKKFVRLRLSTKGWKTVKKYGLHNAARKFELDLHKHNV